MTKTRYRLCSSINCTMGVINFILLCWWWWLDDFVWSSHRWFNNLKRSTFLCLASFFLVSSHLIYDNFFFVINITFFPIIWAKLIISSGWLFNFLFISSCIVWSYSILQLFAFNLQISICTSKIVKSFKFLTYVVWHHTVAHVSHVLLASGSSSKLFITI